MTSGQFLFSASLSFKKSVTAGQGLFLSAVMPVDHPPSGLLPGYPRSLLGLAMGIGMSAVFSQYRPIFLWGFHHGREVIFSSWVTL